MVNRLPFQITPGGASRGSVVHASDAALTDLSRSHAEEDISRLQSAAQLYSSSLTYEVGDFIVESSLVYRCITQVAAPETFDPGKWEQIGFPQTPWLSDIDAADFSLANIPDITFNDITEPATPAAGKAILWLQEFINVPVLRYKADDGVVQNILEDNLIIARNNTGITIAKGQAVYISGSDGASPTIELAQADTLATSPGAGLAQSDILNTALGFVVINGTVVGVSTLGFSVGDILYLSATTAGDLVSIPPTHPNLAQIMGAVLTVGASGVIGAFIGQIAGGEDGTNSNSYKIGDTGGGAKIIQFTNNFTGTLSWNPTASETLTLPDASDTLIGRTTTDTLISKTMSGFSNTFTDIAGFTGLATQSQDLNMGNNKVVAVTTPTTGTDAANKTYVDSLVSGLKIKDAAVLATTGNITLSGNQTIDGFFPILGDRILVKDQTLSEENGVYNVDAAAWPRTTDTDTDTEIVNMSIFIEGGTVNADSSWALTTPLPIVIDVTPLDYAQTSAGTNSPLNSKGDIWGYDIGQARIPVGTDGFVLTANSGEDLGVSWTEQFLTPWVSNIDANGFDLVDLSNIEFRETTGAPTGVSAIWLDGGGLNIENTGGGIMKFVFNGGIAQSFTSDQLEMNGTFIDNVNFINSNIGSPAASGFIRMGINQFITSRNLSGLGDVGLIGLIATGDTQVNAETGRVVDLSISDIPIVAVNAISLDMLNNQITNIEFADFGEITTISSADTNQGRLFVNDDNGITKMRMVDSAGVVSDITSSGFLTTSASTDSVSDNQYFAVSGHVLSGSSSFDNQASLIPRNTRFYNLYLRVTSNSSNTETWTLYDGSGSPTSLQVTIPAGNTGTFSNTTDVVTVSAGTSIAYRISNINGTLIYASTGMAMDVLI